MAPCPHAKKVEQHDSASDSEDKTMFMDDTIIIGAGAAAHDTATAQTQTKYQSTYKTRRDKYVDRRKVIEQTCQ